METIVVGVDGSDCSLSALRWAVQEARLRRAKIRAVHAWSFPHVSTFHEAAHVIELPLADEAAAALDRAVAAAHPDGPDVEIEQVVVEGPAAAMLVEAARDASLLVVGSRGLGGFTGLLLGSVSQQCAQHAACPLVIIREEAPL
jgi:nucleotide-binding universal stress UspA family protein